MARDFQKLSEVNVIEEITEDAKVLVEKNGEIYRAPKTSVGGGSKGMIVKLTAYKEVQPN